MKFLCQTQSKIIQAVLVQTVEEHRLITQWPNSNALAEAIKPFAKDVAHKQRIHLAKLDNGDLLLGQPIIIDGSYFGAIIVAMTNSNSQDTKKTLEFLSRNLLWLQFLIGELTNNSQTLAESTPSMPIARVSSLIEALLKEASLQETEISLVNLLATQMQCTRVSLGWQTSSGVTLGAVSFSANFDRRTHAMQMLVDTMNEASDQSMDIHCIANEILPNTEFSTQIKRNHSELLRQQSLQSLHSILLRKDKRILGVITFEKSDSNGINAEQLAFIHAQLPFVAQLLDLKRSASAGLWHHVKSLSQQQLSRGFGTHTSAMKVIGIITLVVATILFIPQDYQIASDANLKSAYKNLLVSPQDGYLKTIKARPGDIVKKGDLLAQLNDDELSLQRRKLASQVQQYQQEYDTALANSNRVAAVIADTQVDQASIQLRLIEQQLSRIQLLAPTDGIIVSDDISQSLGAPVKQGDVLFEIAAAEGYLVQLMIDERDIAELAVGQKGHVKLASLPHQVFEFTVKTITPLSEILNGRNYFKVDAVLTGETNILRPGMTGTGKIIAGQHSLGWIWFHDVWHWLSLKLWW